MQCKFIVGALLLASSLTSWAANTGKGLFLQGSGSVPACASCHGPRAEGAGNGQFPALAGLPTEYIVAQLSAFADGNRTNAIMAPFARQLSKSQINEVAAWISGLQPVYSLPGSKMPGNPLGQMLVAMGDAQRRLPGCTSCHGPELRGGGPFIPGLAGQSETYLKSQLMAFASGSRPGGPQDLMGSIARKLKSDEIGEVAAYIAGLDGSKRPSPVHDGEKWQASMQEPATFTPPPELAMPSSGEYGRMLELGERIFNDTPRFAGKFVGNQLSCRNCHLALGRDPGTSPLWAAVPRYPMYRGKNRKVNTFSMRLQGCFIYSENGKPPPVNSDVMVALQTYAYWLATGLPIGIKPAASGYPKIVDPAQTPDPARGEVVYKSRCVMCHGNDGAGRVVAGERVFPALWGPESFNWGAGMHRVNTAAAFIKSAMPLGKGGSLEDQDAWDVAAFVESHPRPQDPRYKGDIEATRKQYHAKHPYDYYGKTGRTGEP